MKRFLYSILCLIAMTLSGAAVGFLIDGFFVFITWDVNWELFWQTPRFLCAVFFGGGIAMIAHPDFPSVYNQVDEKP